ncbi:DAK2 domain-containing protein [Companilactobacillus paralimentarius]|uniref:DAK2 domain-containing protein n=1 Tax=Companilactobacillus paralimentarius TaxID=83526 RepID=UPI00285361A4|nr:DAK2 domain-containing protein [Companilactobacillus paralimentarius]MDR4934301.1 DAK2 domain-containing protein [Companilactobacillus paralimentarius]
MSKELITKKEFSDMVRVASHRLEKNAKFVNSLNVFPVPDGDTGTNMSLTIQSGFKAVNESESENVGVLGKALAKGLLMGARGNSGVITSQIFRGFSKSIEDKDSLTAMDLAKAFDDGVKTAYKAVMKPVEGTILTVARYGAEAAMKKVESTNDTIEILQAVVAGAKVGLEKTPSLLPVLKEVGVVDSGGQGLVFIYEGFLEGLSGQVSNDEEYVPDEKDMSEMVNASHHQSAQGQFNTDDIENGYCTEMMVELGDNPTSDEKFDNERLRSYLDTIGDSLICVSDDEVVKVHVHTNYPYKVWEAGRKYGSLSKIKIDNMRLQHETIVEEDEPFENAEAPKEEAKQLDYAVIAVSSGEGLAKLFESLGVTNIISGGQTMNPSTNDIVDAINKSNAKRALVLPNNGNIIMAAKQAVDLVDIPVAIVATKTISQGMTAMLSFNPESDLEDNKENMEDSLDTVKSGQITQAIRDTEIDGLKITKGHYMGIVDGKILVDDADIIAGTEKMLDKMIDEDSEVITILVGKDGNTEDAQRVADYLDDKYADLETEIHQGDQPVYPYLISVE